VSNGNRQAECGLEETSITKGESRKSGVCNAASPICRGRDTELESRFLQHAKSTGEVRARLGNPFFSSGGRRGHPQNATHTVAKHTGRP